MIALAVAACAVLFALGHAIRDGLFDFNSLTGGVYGSAIQRGWLGTNTGARPVGAIVCGLGAWCVVDWRYALIVAGGVALSFLFDQKHAAGQGARTLRDAGELFISGLTSAMVLAFVAGELVSPPAALIMFVGVTKPGWWFLARIVRPERWWAPLVWSRVAAGMFGGAMGLALGLAG